MYVSTIIAAGGLGSRFGGDRPKQLIALAGVPILQRSVEAFLRHELIAEIVVAVPDALLANPPRYLRERSKPITVVGGGRRRQDSVTNAFARISAGADLVVIHDAARPLVSDALITRTVEAAERHGAAIAALASTDTVKRVDRDGVVVGTLPRHEIYLAQTPQAFRRDVLRDALEMAESADATDEAMLAERAGHRVHVVEGDARNVKITTPDDAAVAEQFARPRGATFRIGHGYDLHRLVPGRPLILGGVTIPFDRGLQGHSDADAVCHAVTDAVLGACAAGDIGRHFPDTESTWKGADSLELLRRAVAIVRARGALLVNVDVTIVAEHPRMAPHVDAMRDRLASALGIDRAGVSVKGKTNEGVDATGAGDAIAVHAVALVTSQS